MKRANRMMIWPAILLLAVATAVKTPAQNSAPGQQPPLRLVKTFTLPAEIKGHFDHLVIDTQGKRLFATPEDFHEVLVLEVETGKIIHHIQGIEKPHAVLYRPDIDKIYVTDGEDGSLKVFDGKTYKLEHRIALLKDADSIGFDPATKNLYIDNGGGDAGQKYSMLSVVDTSSFTKLADIKIDGDTLEAMALEANRPRLYVNNREKNQVAVVDRWSKKVIASWPVTMGKTNVTMALDEPHHRLFVGCRSGQIVVMDTNTGKELKALPIVKGIDDLIFDAASKRMYAAGDGALSVYDQADADTYRSLGNVTTGPLGKTERLVPEMDRLFVAVPQHGTTSPTIMVFEPKGTKMAAASPAPPVIYHVDDPAAQRLVMNTLSAHPCLIKLGLHGVAPDQTQSVILANGNLEKVGRATTGQDIADISDGKTFCRTDQVGAFYDMKLPMYDASDRRIGMLVMEIPFSAAATPQEAIRKAESIRGEMAAQIPDLSSLFRN